MLMIVSSLGGRSDDGLVGTVVVVEEDPLARVRAAVGGTRVGDELARVVRVARWRPAHLVAPPLLAIHGLGLAVPVVVDTGPDAEPDLDVAVPLADAVVVETVAQRAPQDLGDR